ncbi:DUF1190 domain-containing protein [uncultured Pseudomonas sp.]|uniref:DUF1190 domain-containing protein n=1 Tax=uncultured Pseudomonas sp. TaxID=114707 RepID=UPI0025E60566|nr:DUF1190 domain-containing protein [uncultured Pseudomonas sp.]
MKRSQALKLVLIGAPVLTLAWCTSRPTTGYTYATAEQCTRDGVFSNTVCAREYANARSAHALQAPRYVQPGDCEADFGVGGCEGPQPYYTPRMSGFLINREPAAGSNVPDVDLAHDRRYDSRPLYRSLDNPGTWRTGSNVAVADRSGRVAVDRAAQTVDTGRFVSRGGFGQAAAARASSGG